VKTQAPPNYLNSTGRMTYSRVRLYKRKDKFTYCKITDLKQLKTLLENKDLLSQTGQICQNQTANNVDPKLKIRAPKY